LVAAIVLALLVLPAVEGTVAAKGRQHQGRQPRVERNGQHKQVQSASRKPAKRKNKKSKAQGRRPNGAQTLADPGAGSAPGAGTTTTSGNQGFAGGLATSLPRTTYIYDIDQPCDGAYENLPYANPQRCNGPIVAGAYYVPSFAAQVEVIASSENCSTMRFEINWLDGTGEHTWTSEPVSPGGSTGVHDLGNDIRMVRINAIGVRGGCNFGTLSYWAATVKIMTPSDLSLILAQK
jgi:hypothetical protein